jgi:NADPH:quinone reductase
LRAAVVPRRGPPEVIEITPDWPEPEPPGPGEVLVAVEAAGLNPSDTKIRSSGGGGQVEPPYVAGREAAGRVLEAGEGVSGLRPGDPVFAFFGWGSRPGGHAERLVVAADALALRPDGPLLETAGLPLAGLTALQGIQALDAPVGSRLLITSGSGGVGHLAVQIAVAQGYEVVSTTGPDNVDFVRDLGAKEVFDYHDSATPERLAGTAHVLDSVGAANILALAPRLATGARVAAVAGVPEDLGEGIHVTRIRCEANSERLTYLAGLMEERRLRVTVQKVFPLSRLSEAHRLLEGGHVRGKLVIDIAA